MSDRRPNTLEDYDELLSARSNKHTPGPWIDPDTLEWLVEPRRLLARHEDALLMGAAPDLLEAAQLLEAAEMGRQDCEECDGEGEPEACGACFPAFDDARIKRRIAIEKAKSGRVTAGQRSEI